MQDRPSSALPYGTSSFYASLVDRCVQGLLHAVGEDDIDAVLMIGAPTRGEATVVETPDGAYSLSDIDLACVARPGADVARLRARLASWVAGVNVELAGACSGIDASVKTRGGDAPVHPLISTFEMLRSPTVVWGSEDVVGELPKVDLEDVPAWDSLVLLHNRTVEQVLLSRTVGASARGGRGTDAGRGQDERAREDRSRPGEPAPVSSLSSLYASGKFVLDAVTGLLFLERNVPETYADRARVFADETLDRPGNERLRSAVSEFLPDVAAWARFKSSGRPFDLSGIPGVTVDDPAAAARTCFLRYATLCGVMWRAVLGRVVGVDAVGMPIEDAVRLCSKLESPPSKGARALKMLRSPAGRAGLFSTTRSLGGSSFASPRVRAYVTAVLTYLSFGDSENLDTLCELVDRHHPFRVPTGFEGAPIEQKRDTLVERLELFHASTLRGRTIPEST